MECYTLIKKEQATTTCNNMDESLRRHDEQRWQTHKKHVLNTSMCMSSKIGKTDLWG